MAIFSLVAISNSAQAFYRAEQGRWMSRDPIGEQGGPNLYGFVGNDAANQWDYLGMKWPGDPYRISFLGFNPTGSVRSEDGRGLINIGADNTYSSREEATAIRDVIRYFDINNDGKLNDNDCPPFDLRITGYSWGAISALKMVSSLNRSTSVNNDNDFKIRMGLIDPVPSARNTTIGPNNYGPRRSQLSGGSSFLKRERNVVWANNYYQSLGCPECTLLLPGFVFVGIPINGFMNTDFAVMYENDPYAHISIVRDHGQNMATQTFYAEDD